MVRWVQPASGRPCFLLWRPCYFAAEARAHSFRSPVGFRLGKAPHENSIRLENTDGSGAKISERCTPEQNCDQNLEDPLRESSIWSENADVSCEGALLSQSIATLDVRVQFCAKIRQRSTPQPNFRRNVMPVATFCCGGRAICLAVEAVWFLLQRPGALLLLLGSLTHSLVGFQLNRAASTPNNTKQDKGSIKPAQKLHNTIRTNSPNFHVNKGIESSPIYHDQ